MPDGATPKPLLARLLEDVAALLGLTSGTLELVFQDGHLTKFYSHSRGQGARSLAYYDVQAGRLLEQLAHDDPAGHVA